MVFPLDIKNSKIDVTYLDKNYPRRLGLHTGIDANGKGGGNTDLNMPFRSIDSGLVVYASDNAPSGSWGGLIVVWHEQLGIWSRYGHHSPKSCRVSVGEKVKEGQVLAGIGRGRNNAFLAHLHFDVLKRKPLNWLRLPNWAYWPMHDLTGLLDTFINPMKLFSKFKVAVP